MTERLHDLIAQQAIHIAELEAELTRWRRHNSPHGDNRARVHNSNRPSQVEEVNNHVTLQTAYAKLTHEHQQLQADHADCQARIAKAEQGYAKAKEKVQEWHAYVHQQLKRREGRTSIPSSTTTPSEGSRRVSRNAQDVLPRPSPMGSSGRSSKVEQRKSSDPPMTSHTSDRSSHNVQLGSSQSTMPETQGVRGVKREPETQDLDPVVVTHVKTKRRKMDKLTTPRIKQEPGTPDQPVLLMSDNKDENAGPASNTRELSDLDTPRASHALRLPQKGQSHKKTSLRSLPLDALQLDHFKLNPNFKGPYLRAIDPNIRRPQRRCPPGCKRVDCCGDKVRKTVELGGVQLSGRSDETVLCEYLGSRWQEIMATYEPERRRDVLIHAHAVSFAATAQMREPDHDRARTPPGFWRMNMPTTQENEQDIRQAKEIDARLIKERWQEANRHNGRWMFRDEA